MFTRYSRIVIAAVACLLASCSSEENSVVTGLGWVQFDLGVDQMADAAPTTPFRLTMATADGSYAKTWADVADFDNLEGFYAGHYTASVVSGAPDQEGYGVPCYMGEADFEVLSGKRAVVPITASLAQAMMRVRISEGMAQAYPLSKATMHTAGHAYLQVLPDEERPALLLPGLTYFYITIADGAGQEVTVAPEFVLPTVKGRAYDVDIDLSGDKLSLKCGDFGSEMTLTPALFNSAAPEVAPQGFEPGVMLKLTEGYEAAEPVVMTVNAPAGLQSVTLTSNMPDSQFPNFPQEVNLLNAPAAVTDAGLRLDRPSDDVLAVDFTKLLSELAVNSSASATFTLHARDRLGRVSEPMTLIALISSVTISDASQTRALVGINMASVTVNYDEERVEEKDFNVYITDSNGNALRPAKDISVSLDPAESAATITFSVGEGVNDVPVRIDYMGNPKLYTVIERDVPEYAMTVDPFATTAMIYVDAGDMKVTEAIVDYATITANGDATSVLMRSPEKGIIVVSGLKPSTAYTLKSTVVKGRYEPSVKVSTEAAAEVPTGDFEDVDVLFTYKRLPSGGAYSSSAFPIFTQQNFSDVSVSWPQKHWASVNDKTFSMAAANHNTWYMQPSAMIDYDAKASGSKSMRLVSVGWALDGEEIEPYTQQNGQYVPYNANVPYVAHRAAGKLFLGSYAFEPATLAESYDEGVAFHSRPSSLNGFYRYVPDAGMPTDYGIVEVEIINDEEGWPIVLASGTMQLRSAHDFVSFNLPLTYEVLNLRATRLKVSFSSSRYCGTIEEEDASVPTTADVPHAAYIGSQLWVDNLTFSY